MTDSLFINISLIISGVIFLLFFFSKRMRSSDVWRATVTPLASIIGSGFLIVAPLLWILVGYYALWVLLVVVVVAYALGSVVRYNIQYVEPCLTRESKDGKVKILNTVSYVALGLSYLISIAFYIRLLSAFTLNGFFVENVIATKILTSLILLSIGLIGYFRGFNRLELLEVISVNIKISVIVMLLVGLFLYDWAVLDFHFIIAPNNSDFSFLTLRKIFGVLLIIQGFEVSRYIGHKYKAELRIKTMKLAQIIASIIYLAFIYLILFLMCEDQKVTETVIIDLTRNVSPILPLVITAAAIFSQFSAAIADTIGGGGILIEYSKSKISHSIAYLSIALLSIALIWATNIFEIIAFASRMFAAYYCIQCLQAFYMNHLYKLKGHLWSVYFLSLALLMFVITIFGISAE